eukprot:scaffold134574_cov31-Tisochrysis_lutea.AAC.1
MLLAPRPLDGSRSTSMPASVRAITASGSAVVSKARLAAACAYLPDPSLLRPRARGRAFVVPFSRLDRFGSKRAPVHRVHIFQARHPLRHGYWP